MRVVLTEAALLDLADIGHAIKKDNPRRAATFVDELQERCRRLGEMPFAFALLPGWEQHATRRRPYGRYLIFYRVTSQQVDILRVLHGARDYEAILFPDA